MADANTASIYIVPNPRKELSWLGKSKVKDLRQASVDLRKDYIGWYDLEFPGRLHNLLVDPHVASYGGRMQNYWCTRFDSCGPPSPEDMLNTLYMSKKRAFISYVDCCRSFVITPWDTWSVAPTDELITLWYNRVADRPVAINALDWTLRILQYPYADEAVTDNTFYNQMANLDPGLAVIYLRAEPTLRGLIVRARPGDVVENEKSLDEFLANYRSGKLRSIFQTGHIGFDLHLVEKLTAPYLAVEPPRPEPESRLQYACDIPPVSP